MKTSTSYALVTSNVYNKASAAPRASTAESHPHSLQYYGIPDVSINFLERLNFSETLTSHTRLRHGRPPQGRRNHCSSPLSPLRHHLSTTPLRDPFPLTGIGDEGFTFVSGDFYESTRSKKSRCTRCIIRRCETLRGVSPASLILPCLDCRVPAIPSALLGYLD